MSSYNVGKCTHTESINFSSELPACREAGDHMTNTQSCENRSIIFLHPKAAAGTIWGFSPYFYVILKI